VFTVVVAYFVIDSVRKLLDISSYIVNETKLLRRPRRRWENNTKVRLGWERYGSGSISCPTDSFDISDCECSVFHCESLRELVVK
jgi:hypothetical protein